jgi:RHS repeat-associated protein
MPGASTLTLLPPSSITGSDSPWADDLNVMDFDGDGVADILTLWSGSVGNQPCPWASLDVRFGQRTVDPSTGAVSLSFGVHQCLDTSAAAVAAGAARLGVSNYYPAGRNGAPRSGWNALLMDATGDGVLDYVVSQVTSPVVYVYPGYRSGGTGAWGFGAPMAFSMPAGAVTYGMLRLDHGNAKPQGVPPSGTIFETAQQVDLMDMNGDGIPDLMSLDAGGTTIQWRGDLLTKKGFTQNGQGPSPIVGFAGNPGFALATSPLVPDLVVCPTEAQVGCVPGTMYCSTSGVDFARSTGSAVDLNGDGLPDFLTRETGGLRVWWNRGDRFEYGSFIAAPSVAGVTEDIYPGQTYRSVGGRIEPGYQCDNAAYPSDPLAPPTLSTPSLVSTRGAPNAQFLDLNGDGIPDYIRWDKSSGAFFAGVGSSPRLTAVTVPTGARYTVTYKGSAVFDGAYGRAQKYVVSSIDLSGLALEPNTTWYWYAEPVVGAAPRDLGARAPLGFKRTWTKDNVSGIVRAKRWATDSYLTTGSALSVEWGIQAVSGPEPTPPQYAVFRSHVTDYRARAVGSSTCVTASDAQTPAGSAYVVVPTYAEQVRYVGAAALKSSAAQACTDVDDFGNPRKITVTPADGGGSYQLLASFDANATCKTCPTQTWTSPDGTTASALRHTKYFYSDTSSLQLPLGSAGEGRLKFASRKSNGSTWEVQTATTYLPNGNPDTVTAGHILEANGSLNVSQQVDRKFTYDSFGLRVTTEKVSDATVALLTDTAYDSLTGLAVQVTGPYVMASSAAKPVKTMAYDDLGRPVAAGRGRTVSGNVTISSAISATAYFSAVGVTPAYVKTWNFGAPVSLACLAGGDCAGSIAELGDVKVAVAYVDGLGRTIQVRERMGGSGTSAGNPASVTQLLGSTAYRVSGTVRLDGAGRALATLEPFYSSGEGFEPFASVATGARRGSYATLDGRSRVVCALSGVYAAAVANSAACTQSDSDDLNYRTSVHFTYTAGLPMGGVQTIAVTATAGNAVRGTVTSYDAAGNALLSVDPTLSQTANTFDLLGQVQATTRKGPSGDLPQTVFTTYDLLGRVTEVADPNWLATGQSPTALTDPAGRGRRTIEYYSHGGVKKLTLPALEIGSGATLRPYISTTYGSLLRKTSVVAYEPSYVAQLGWTFSGRTTTFTYDAPYAGDTAYAYLAGRMASASNEIATIAFGYDQDGTPSRRDQWFAGMSSRFGASVTTANDGRVLQTQFVTPYSPDVGYALKYDSFGRPVAMQGTNSGATEIWAAVDDANDTFGAYEAAGLVGSTAASVRGHIRSNGGTVTTSRTYGTYSGQLVAQATTVGATKLYDVGNMTWLGGKLTHAKDTTTGSDYDWAYDTGGRLVTATAAANTSGVLTQNYSHSFGFTPVWNLLTANVAWEGSATSTQSYSYSGTDQATQAPGGYQAAFALTYDGSGNIVDRRSQTAAETLKYTAEGYLRSIVRGTSTDEVLYYDPFGNLAYRRSGTFLWLYVGDRATVTGTTTCTTDPCVPTAGTAKVNVHVLLARTRVATVRTSPGQTTDQAFGSVLYYHRDRQGSVVATTTTGGVVGVQYRYGPYGEFDKATGNETVAGSDLGYTGGLRLTGGLIDLRARVYDPSFRRFLQADIVDPLRYTYTNGDPTNYVDPSGHLPKFYGSRTGSLLVVSWVNDNGTVGQDVFDTSNPLDLQRILSNSVEGTFAYADTSGGQSTVRTQTSWPVDLRSAYTAQGFSRTTLSGLVAVSTLAGVGILQPRAVLSELPGALSDAAGGWVIGNRNAPRVAGTVAGSVLTYALLTAIAGTPAGWAGMATSVTIAAASGGAGVIGGALSAGETPTMADIALGVGLGAASGVLPALVGAGASIGPTVAGTTSGIGSAKLLVTFPSSAAAGVLAATVDGYGLARVETVGMCAP